MKRQKRIGAAGMVLFAAAVIFSGAVRGSVLTAGERCLTVLIPSLYAYSMLAAFLLRAGAISGVPGLVLFSQLGGYPVGAQMLRDAPMPREQARRLLCVCMGCGPGFLFGTVCRGLPAGLSAWMLFSVTLPNLLLLPLVMPHTDEKPALPERMPFSLLLTASAESAAAAMLKITAMVMAFAAGTGILEGMGLFALLPVRAGAFVRSVLEISCITDYMAEGGSLPFAAALLSFGGICVHLQMAAMFGAMDWVRFYGFRLLSAVMAYGICLFGVKLLFRDAVSAALTVQPVAWTTGSILPGLCLLVMAVMTMRQHAQFKPLS